MLNSMANSVKYLLRKEGVGKGQELGRQGPNLVLHDYKCSLRDCSLQAQLGLVLKAMRSPLPLSALKHLEEWERNGWITYDILEYSLDTAIPYYITGASRGAKMYWENTIKTAKSLASKESQISVDANNPFNRDGKVLSYNKQALRLYKCSKHGVWHLQVVWKAVTSRKVVKDLNIAYPWSSDSDKKHTNLDVASMVYWTCAKGSDDARKRVDQALATVPVGAYNVTVTCWLAHALGNKQWTRIVNVVREYNLCCLSTGSYKTWWKEVSIAVRRCARWIDGTTLCSAEVGSLAYLELAIGRASQTTDWAEEKDKRTKKVVNLRCALDQPEIAATNRQMNDKYLARLRDVLKTIMVTLVKARDKWPTWSEQVRTRQGWVSGGSAGGAKVVIEGETIRINKRSYFEQTSSKLMESWLDSEPIIRATGSEKFESGKSRAIYGTQPVDYAIMAYVIGTLEKKLHRIMGIDTGLHGLDEVASLTLRVKLFKAAMKRIHGTMIDYADFNYQHTLQAQSLVFEVLAERLEEIGAESDVIKAAHWCAKALLNQWVRFPGKKGYTKVTQGLFSGVRGTNFINTLLNLAYYLLACIEVEENFGLRPINVVHIHNGDDVWISNESRLWASALYGSLLANGFDFSPMKQMFDVNRGEFLRVLYDATGMAAYIARPLATMTISQLQSTVVDTPQGIATARNSQVQVLFRRGFSLEGSTILWWALVPDGLRLKLPDHSGVAIPICVARADARDGGLDLGEPGTIAVRGVRIPNLPQICIRSERLEGAIPSHMAHAWIEHMSSKIVAKFDSKKIERQLHGVNVTDSLSETDRVLALRSYERQLKVWLTKVHDVQNLIPKRTLMTPLEVDDNISTSFLYDLELLESNTTPKNMLRSPGYLAMIVNAISASPYRDLATVVSATGLDVITAARAAISLCANDHLRMGASGALSAIERSVAPAVARRIISGVRGVSPAYGAYFSSPVLSWLGNCAVNMAVVSIIGSGCHCTDDWDEKLYNWQIRVLAQAQQSPIVMSIVHF